MDNTKINTVIYIYDTHLIVRRLSGHVKRRIEAGISDGVPADDPVCGLGLVALGLSDMESLALHPEAKLAVLRAVHLLAPQGPQNSRVLLDGYGLGLGEITVGLDNPRLVSVEHRVVGKILGQLLTAGGRGRRRRRLAYAALGARRCGRAVAGLGGGGEGPGTGEGARSEGQTSQGILAVGSVPARWSGRHVADVEVGDGRALAEVSRVTHESRHRRGHEGDGRGKRLRDEGTLGLEGQSRDRGVRSWVRPVRRTRDRALLRHFELLGLEGGSSRAAAGLFRSGLAQGIEVALGRAVVVVRACALASGAGLAYR